MRSGAAPADVVGGGGEAALDEVAHVHVLALHNVLALDHAVHPRLVVQLRCSSHRQRSGKGAAESACEALLIIGTRLQAFLGCPTSQVPDARSSGNRSKCPRPRESHTSKQEGHANLPVKNVGAAHLGGVDVVLHDHLRLGLRQRQHLQRAAVMSDATLHTAFHLDTPNLRCPACRHWTAHMQTTARMSQIMQLTKLYINVSYRYR